MSNKFLVALGTAAVSSLVIGTSAVQAVETFSIDNVALNTNFNFRLIDGNPRMSIYQRNDNDPDQQFDRLSGNRGGILLKHRSTGRCLNAHYLSNGAEINVWPCDPNDPDQKWNLEGVSGGRILIKRTGTNLCVDTPTRSNTGKVHLWTCDGNQPNQRWLSSAPPTIGYRSNIESVLRNFFTNTANTRGENWSQKTITEMWDRVVGESAQFPGGGFTTGDIWQVDMPSDVYGVYQDLSNAIFGSVKAVTTGYAYDYGYYPGYGAHSALDIGASNGTSLKAVVNGTVVDNRPQYQNGSFNGYWIAIDELDVNGQKTGRRWWYGHLATRNINVGSRVTAGQTVLGTVGQGHLHLGVVSTYTAYTTSMYGNEVINGKGKGSYSADVQDVLNRTMSPLQAYWNSRNGIKQ